MQRERNFIVVDFRMPYNELNGQHIPPESQSKLKELLDLGLHIDHGEDPGLLQRRRLMPISECSARTSERGWVKIQYPGEAAGDFLVPSTCKEVNCRTHARRSAVQCDVRA